MGAKHRARRAHVARPAPRPSGASPSRSARAWHAGWRAHTALIVGVTALAYAASLGGEWISDDVQVIAREPLLRSLAPANLRAIFTSFDGPNYGPLKVLSLAVDYRLWGSAPPGYHLTNLALHAANALAIYWLLLRLGESTSLALVVSLLWALHPAQVESVAWVSERKNVLSTFFFLLAFHVYLGLSERPRPRGYAFLLVLFVCALLAKINTVVLPAIIALYEVAVRSRLRARDLALAGALLVVGVGPAAVNLIGNPVIGAHYHGGSLAVTMKTSSTVVPRYLGLIVWPTGTSWYHAVTLHDSWLDPMVLLGVATVVVIVAAVLALALRRRSEAFWVAWFLVTLSPMLNLVPFPALMADRYLYIPILGPLVLLARGGQALGDGLRIRWVAPVLAGLGALVCFGLTVARVPVFHDELRLWEDWAVHTPYLTADRPLRRPADPEKIRFLRDALAHDPERAVLHNNLGALFFEAGRLPEAVAELERAHALDPRDPAIALDLGFAYLNTGLWPEAARVLDVAVRGEPPSYYAQLSLGRAYLRLRDPERARPALERARLVRPWAADWRRDWAELEALEREASAEPAG